MAWSFEAGFLEPGESITWGFWWNGYRGIQVAHAKPKPLEIGDIGVRDTVTLRVTNPSLKMDFVGNYTYFVTVTNLDGSVFSYDIVGTRVD
jgi:hypothetical protein